MLVPQSALGDMNDGQTHTNAVSTPPVISVGTTVFMSSPCRRWTCMSAVGGSSSRWTVLICMVVVDVLRYVWASLEVDDEGGKFRVVPRSFWPLAKEAESATHHPTSHDGMYRFFLSIFEYALMIPVTPCTHLHLHLEPF